MELVKARAVSARRRAEHCEILHRRGRSDASVTVECTPKRCRGQQGAPASTGGSRHWPRLVGDPHRRREAIPDLLGLRTAAGRRTQRG